VAIPEIPAVDGAEEEPPSIPSIPSLEERSVWAVGTAEESPKLAEARAAMMATLQSDPEPVAVDARAVAPAKRELWSESDVPAKAAALEWPEPPPVVGASSAPPMSEEPIPLSENDLQKASNPKVPVPAPPPVPRKGGTVPRPR
jgi:hypothetical protein